MIYPVISLIFLLAGFAFGMKWDIDKDMSAMKYEPIKMWSLWIAIVCFALSFIVFYGGSR